MRERKQVFGSVVFFPRILQAFWSKFWSNFRIFAHISDAQQQLACVSRAPEGHGVRVLPCHSSSRRPTLLQPADCNVDQCQTWMCDTTLPLRLSACVCVRHIGLWCHNTREQLAPSAASVAGRSHEQSKTDPHLLGRIRSPSCSPSGRLSPRDWHDVATKHTSKPAFYFGPHTVCAVYAASAPCAQGGYFFLFSGRPKSVRPVKSGGTGNAHGGPRQAGKPLQTIQVTVGFYIWLCDVTVEQISRNGRYELHGFCCIAVRVCN